MNMISFKQHLSEAGDRPQPYTWTKQDSSQYEARFVTSGGETYEVAFQKFRARPDLMSASKPVPVYKDEPTWVIMFMMIDKKNTGHFGVTNTGDSIQVFATVLAVIKDFIQKVHPWQFTFSGDKSEQSRVRLYMKFSDMASRYLPAGWKRVADSGESGTSPAAHFWFYRKK